MWFGLLSRLHNLLAKVASISLRVIELIGIIQGLKVSSNKITIFELLLVLVSSFSPRDAECAFSVRDTISLTTKFPI
jgi:hypothetical protein